jgi:hypothetical protein
MKPMCDYVRNSSIIANILERKMLRRNVGEEQINFAATVSLIYSVNKSITYNNIYFIVGICIWLISK